MRQPERFIEPSIRIGKSRKIVQFVRSEKLGGALFGAEVHERDARAFALNLCAEIGELGDRLAAERSAKVPQEDEQQRPVHRKGREGFAGLRSIGPQKFRRNAVWLEHRRPHLYRFQGKRQTPGHFSGLKATIPSSFAGKRFTPVALAAGRKRLLAARRSEPP